MSRACPGFVATQFRNPPRADHAKITTGTGVPRRTAHDVERNDRQRHDSREEKCWCHGSAVQYVRGTANFQAEQTANQMYTTLISTDHLSQHLDGTWTLIDCRFDLQHDDWGRDQYLQSHIPGAVYAHLSDDMSAPQTGLNGRHPWPSTQAMTAT